MIMEVLFNLLKARLVAIGRVNLLVQTEERTRLIGLTNKFVKATARLGDDLVPLDDSGS